MAIFGSKKKTTTAAKSAAKKPVAKTKAVVPAVEKKAAVAQHDLILRPHVTEKAGIQSEAQNVYTFQVAKHAMKHTIANAVISLYKVTPAKIRIVNLPAKRVFVRGKSGTQSGMKKALVYLKKGDKIEFA